MGEDENILVTATSMQVKVEIVSYGNGNLKGVLYNRHLHAPYTFVCLLQMIRLMERLFDSKRFPEAFMSPRMFESLKNNRNIQEVDGNIAMNDASNLTIEPEAGGAKCTFEIHVMFRQNATWQGQILWTEKNLRQKFRSALEMLLLMNDAMTDGDEGEQSSVKWDKK